MSVEVDGDTAMRILTVIGTTSPDTRAKWTTTADPEIDTAFVGWVSVETDDIATVKWEPDRLADRPNDKEPMSRRANMAARVNDHYNIARMIGPLNLLLLNPDIDQSNELLDLIGAPADSGEADADPGDA